MPLGQGGRRKGGSKLEFGQPIIDLRSALNFLAAQSLDQTKVLTIKVGRSNDTGQLLIVLFCKDGGREHVITLSAFEALGVASFLNAAVQVGKITDRWLRQYSEERPHEFLGNLTPAESPKIHQEFLLSNGTNLWGNYGLPSLPVCFPSLKNDHGHKP